MSTAEGGPEKSGKDATNAAKLWTGRVGSWMKAHISPAWRRPRRLLLIAALLVVIVVIITT
jgi:hypothetical protein